jgi:amino acid transporter/mannitol/fructose-specific phosphotransferase system IIA component (Ntr-type)
MASPSTHRRLKKELGLFDVFAVSTGAMFSSGFFLLPGLAAAQSGPSVALAYLVAGVLILPAMFSAGELATALPRAGGAYYFLDRSLGPLAGTIGGLGTYFALTLKTAFALIGIGAYAAFFVDLPIKTVAVALTLVFAVINIVGAKETTALQRILVTILLVVLAFFTIQGLMYVGWDQPTSVTFERQTPFLKFGLSGLLSTVGFVFVSYAGLTKVASIAEEVKNPDRNIPLGMMLSLGITTFIYVAGVFIMVSVLEFSALSSDLTPVATAAEQFFSWLPGRWGLMLIVIAALAAFASTGNAGLMSASRYPLAMARDRLLPGWFARLGRFNTPTISILVSGGIMIFFIVVLDAEGIAKLASAFQLLIFIFLNLAVVVMRESHIPSYDPGYRSPLYPWVQIFGMVTSSALIAYMGWLAIVFTLSVTLICVAWYKFYAEGKVRRDGAIYHWFSRLGKRRFEGLDVEFRGILKEKGLRGEDPYEQVVARSFVVDLETPKDFSEVVREASAYLARRLPTSEDDIFDRIMAGTRVGATPVTRGVALPHFRTEAIDQPELVLVRSKHSVFVPGDDPLTEDVEADKQVKTLFFLVSPEANPGQHLRILAQIAGRVDEDSFQADWMGASDEQELKEVLLRNDRSMTVNVSENEASHWIEQRLMDLELPGTCLIALVQRDGEVEFPHGSTRFHEGDRITIIGEPDDIKTLRARFKTVE